MLSKERTVSVPSNAYYTVKTWQWIRELQRLGHNIQVSIPEPKPRLGKKYIYLGEQRSKQFARCVCWAIVNRRPKNPKEVFVRFETGETCRVAKEALMNDAQTGGKL